MTHRFLEVLKLTREGLDNIAPEKTFTDLHFDSFDIAEFACNLEDEYKIFITWGMLTTNNNTYKDLGEICKMCESKFSDEI